MTITGATRLYAIVGDPIVQVRSPEVFTERFRAAGVDAVFLPVHVPASRFEAVFAALLEVRNLDGLLVTIPFKTRALPFARHVGSMARAVDAINALRREASGAWVGDMFDGLGFVRAVERKGYGVRGRHAALFGAGGAGSAIAHALAEAGVAAIDLIEPDAAKAHTLVSRLRQLFPDQAFAIVDRVPPGSTLVVNASPVGMEAHDGLPGELGALDPGTVIGDVVISKAPTPIVRFALDRGYGHVTGSDMHEGQVDALFDFFLHRVTSASASASS
ncbi:MAG: shikimate dehydrogenase [Burkholderiales bacterium]|nr:shikimate dehydrogenase [Burkholderiales bacterium]